MRSNESMRSPHLTLQTHALDFWLARGAVALIAGLQLLFVNNNLIFGPRWLAPAFELAMLVPLSLRPSGPRARSARLMPPIIGTSYAGIEKRSGGLRCC